MPIKNPLPLDVSTYAVTGLDKSIESIRQRLDTLTWLSPYNYGRAYTDINSNGNRTPIVYNGSGEYVNAMPDDNVAAMSFFTPISPERTDFNNGKPVIKSERSVALIVWVNLEELSHAESGDSYIYTEALKESVYRILMASPEVVSIDMYKDNDVSEVYEGFDFENLIAEYAQRSINNFGEKRNLLKKVSIQGKYLKHPYAAFRIEFKIKYYLSC